MKKPALICLLLCLFIAPRSMNAQELRDLQKIHILIEDLDHVVTNVGITRNDLNDQVLVALKRDVPKLTINDGKTTNQFYVNISAIELDNGRGVAAHIRVAVWRWAIIESDSGGKIPSSVTVWEDSVTFKGPLDTTASHINEQLDQLVTHFAARYYKDNP